MLFIQEYESPLGLMDLAGSETSLIGAWFKDQKYFKSTISEQDNLVYENNAVLKTAAEWLDAYFGGENPNAGEIPVEFQGTEFRVKVWNFLQKIPYGEVTTYGEIAKQISGKEGTKIPAAQAVGSAVGHNPISVIVPCHRVVGKNGSLTGYAGGLDRKEWLLRHEGIEISTAAESKGRKVCL